MHPRGSPPTDEYGDTEISDDESEEHIAVDLNEQPTAAKLKIVFSLKK
jgi:hypothetical protein